MSFSFDAGHEVKICIFPLAMCVVLLLTRFLYRIASASSMTGSCFVLCTRGWYKKNASCKSGGGARCYRSYYYTDPVELPSCVLTWLPAPDT